jgi:hypothetical protein
LARRFDLLHSTVRRTFYRDEGLVAWNGVMMWRGAVEYAPFRTGRSMLIVGGMKTTLAIRALTPLAFVDQTLLQTTMPGIGAGSGRVSELRRVL